MEINYNHEEIDEIAQVILNEIHQSTTKVVCFKGEMGAGKTTLTKALCKALKVKEEVSSPTFSIVNEYSRNDGGNIYHFDFYRLETEIEALEIGVSDYFESGNLCLIEWPDRVSSFLPDHFILITIQTNTENNRSISLIEYKEH